MCGITGILNIHSQTAIGKPIKNMTDALAHRGPDSDGFYIEESRVALGHRRLSIIDLSTSANQPFFDDSDRYVLIFNGEIYNYLEVKPLLPEYSFKTTSDTEVILAAYIKWGKDCLQYLNGMFAFAIWDKIEQTLFVARDRLGVKPFYYYHDTEHFVFASEIRSLLASGFVPRQLDKFALHDYLMFQSVYAPYTILKNVFQLMPGEYAFVSAKGIQKDYYWKIETPPQYSDVHDRKTVEHTVRDLLSASVERRMISDVPLGGFLSGGIDSSAVVALMAQSSDRPIDTFTVTFGEKKFDESNYAQIIAKKFNTHHTEIRLTPDDFLKELPNALNSVDAPSGDGLNTYVVSKATKEAGITVALSGLGGDELFAGYQYFKHYTKLREDLSYYWKIPQALRSGVLAVGNSLLPKNEKRHRISKILSAPQPSIDEIYPYFRSVNTEEVAKEYLSSHGFATPIIQTLLQQRKKDIEKLPYLSQVSVGELYGYTLNVLLRDTDQFSMASALEVREPFFDYKLVEYLMTVPDDMKLGKAPKNLLVSALHPLLPDEIVYRPKMGFSFPWNDWLLNDLRDFCNEYIQNLSNYDLFNLKTVQSEWQLFLSSKGTKVSWVKIWQIVVLSHWLKTNNIE